VAEQSASEQQKFNAHEGLKNKAVFKPHAKVSPGCFFHVELFAAEYLPHLETFGEELN
jgi:hypothetical protein